MSDFHRKNNGNSSPGVSELRIRSWRNTQGSRQSMKELLTGSCPFCICALSLRAFNFFYLQDRLQSQQDEGACVMQQEYQTQPCELCEEPGPSSPAVTSLASTPHCFGRFLSCVCQTFSRSRKQKPPGRDGTKQAEAGGDAKAQGPGLLRRLGKNKVLPHQSL